MSLLLQLTMLFTINQLDIMLFIIKLDIMSLTISRLDIMLFTINQLDIMLFIIKLLVTMSLTQQFTSMVVRQVRRLV